MMGSKRRVSKRKFIKREECGLGNPGKGCWSSWFWAVSALAHDTALWMIGWALGNTVASVWNERADLWWATSLATQVNWREEYPWPRVTQEKKHRPLFSVEPQQELTFLLTTGTAQLQQGPGIPGLVLLTCRATIGVLGLPRKDLWRQGVGVGETALSANLNRWRIAVTKWLLAKEIHFAFVRALEIWELPVSEHVSHLRLREA